MSNINVFAEEFEKILPARQIPLAKDEDIRLALEYVQELNSMFLTPDGEYMVDPDWHSAAVLDFADWLFAHVPGADDVVMAYNFGDIPIMDQYLTYATVEYDALVAQMLSELEAPLTSKQLAFAHIVAESFCSLGDPLTISSLSDSQEFSCSYIPVLDKKMELSDLDGLTDEEIAEFSYEQRRYWGFFKQIVNIALSCLVSETAAMAVCKHGSDGMDSIYVLCFVEGRVTSLSGTRLSSLIPIITGDREKVADRLTDSEVHCEYELDAFRAAAAICSCVDDAVGNAMEHSAVLGRVDENGELLVSLETGSMETCLLGENLLGNYAGLSVPGYLEDYDDYLAYYDDILDSNPYITEEEAAAALVAACVAESACEKIETGAFTESSERVKDLADQIGFGLASTSLAFEDISLLNSYASALDDQRDVALTEEIYDGMTDGAKIEISSFIDKVLENGNNVSTLLAMAGTVEPGNTLTGSVITLPSNLTVTQDVKTHMKKVLRGLIVKISLSGEETTMLVSNRENPQSNKVELSAAKWKHGRWQGLSADATIELFNDTQSGQALMITPADRLEYRALERPAEPLNPGEAD